MVRSSFLFQLVLDFGPSAGMIHQTPTTWFKGPSGRMLLLILPDLSQNQLSVPFPALNAVMVFKLTITELIKIKLTSKQSRVPCVGFQVYYIDSRCAMCPFSATRKCKPAICFHGRCFPGKWHAQGANNPIVNTHQNAHMLSYIAYSCLLVPLCILSDPVPISLHISVPTTLQYLRTKVAGLHCLIRSILPLLPIGLG